MISTSDPVQAALSHQLQLLRSSTHEERKSLIQLQQDQFDHLELYSHEIKNSLMELQAASENSDHVKSADVKKAVRQANYHLDMLLNDERLSMSSNDYDFEWVNLEHLVQAVLQDNSSIFINRQLIPEISGLAAIRILTDRKWLRFCVNQLLSNAIKYTPRGQKIRISWDRNVLSIMNPGPGISQSDLARVFENGFTGSNGHQTTKSTGMGLFLVKKTADQLNFQVQLRSVPDHSTTASLIFATANVHSN